MIWIPARAGGGRCAPWFSLAIVLVLASGCMNQQLRYSAARTTAVLPDLHYQQIVDNLARTAANPGFLPYLAVAGQGSVQVTDTGSASISGQTTPKLFSTGLPTLNASRNVTGTWNMGTITSPEKLRSMQLIYHNALRGAARAEPAFGWLHAGGKKEVPREAYYVGHHDNVYVWVRREGLAGLTELTLAIMDIATREEAATPVAAGEPSLKAAGPPVIFRRNFQVPPVGPVFTPGTR